MGVYVQGVAVISLISGPPRCLRTCFVFCTLETWCFAVQSLPCLFDEHFVYGLFNSVLSALCSQREF